VKRSFIGKSPLSPSLTRNIGAGTAKASWEAQRFRNPKSYMGHSKGIMGEGKGLRINYIADPNQLYTLKS